jgi:hypothetical protein
MATENHASRLVLQMVLKAAVAEVRSSSQFGQPARIVIILLCLSRKGHEVLQRKRRVRKKLLGFRRIHPHSIFHPI